MVLHGKYRLSPLQQQHLQEYNLQLHRLAVLVHKQILPGQMHRASQHLSIRLKNQFRRNQFHLPHLPELTIYKLHLIQKPVLPLHEDHIKQVARRLKSVEILSAAAQLYEKSHLTRRIALSCCIKISPVGTTSFNIEF